MTTIGKKYSILFQTAGDIPAPHAFHALVRLELTSGGKLKAEFTQEYIDRDEIPLDEIEAEGFSENDDFSWKGNLPKFWLDNLLQIHQKTEWIEAVNSQVLFMEPDSTEWISPTVEKDWIRFTEELIQACLEEGGKELPMEMTLGSLEKNNFYEKIRLEWSFSRREVTAQKLSGEKVVFKLSDWDEGQNQLKSWIEDEASRKDLYQFPTSRGIYWLMNNEVWLPYTPNQEGRIWEWVDKEARVK
ncbi:MAG TPA: hypothetical protein PK509_00925 [Catalimonadaceae bacterium]|nr:hypothetical protein [Catalimonadaceae bacterium]